MQVLETQLCGSPALKFADDSVCQKVWARLGGLGGTGLILAFGEQSQTDH